MPFGTDNLDYGAGLGDDDFGSGGSSIYDEYMGDAYTSDDLEVSDYLYEYDPLKEQNLLADYMSGLTDLGDKTEGVRTKAIAERKALSKSIRGGLSSGSMEDAASKQKDDASRAQSSLYRGQASSKRALGENIGSLREAYEGDIASGVEEYNANVGEGQTAEDSASIDSAYQTFYGVGSDGSSTNAIQNSGAPSGDYAIQNASDPSYPGSGSDNDDDTWLNKSTGIWYEYKDDFLWGLGTGSWKNKGKWTTNV
tara:strand:- start:690 stop:1448 length:759 start_codon:yes stop_codon:yes gene_type:complete